METRLVSRTGANDRMAMATASWAVTAALTGAWAWSARACRISAFGSETTSLQIPSVSTCRISARFFARQASVTVLFQRRPDVVQALNGCIVETILPRQTEQLPG